MFTTAKARSPSSVQLELVALARESLRETGRVSGDHSDTIVVERPQRTKLSVPPASPTPPAAEPAAEVDNNTDKPPQQSDTMTAVESHTAPAPFLDAPAEPPTSRFTAVNNREPLPAAPPTNNGSRRASEDHAETQARATPPAPEKLTITTSNTQRDNWAETVNGDKAAGSQSVAAPPSFPEGESTHKRKRSGSVDRDSAQPSSSSSYHKHSLPALKPNEQQKGSPSSAYPESAQSSKRDSQSVTRDPYVTPQTPYPHYPEESRENSAASWYSHQIDNRTPVDGGHSAVSQQQHLSPDDQLREALQRENNSDGQGAYSETSPAQDDNRGAAYQGTYGQVQADHKKRKRNFSNRTKTGCMTCRKRKKKCDESRPECESNLPPLCSHERMLICSKVITAFAVDLSAMATQVAANGPRQKQNQAPYPSNLRKATRQTRANINPRRTNSSNLSKPSASLYRHTAGNSCALTPCSLPPDLSGKKTGVPRPTSAHQSVAPTRGSQPSRTLKQILSQHR